MKKKSLLIILTVLFVSCVIFFSVKVIEEKNRREEIEALRIFEKNIAIRAFVVNSKNNLEDIQKKLENMEYVKNVELVSKETALKEMKKQFEEIDQFYNRENIFPDSFIITVNINNIEDLKKVKTLEEKIKEIEGINRVSSSYNVFIKVYEETGIKGIIEFDKIYAIMKEQGVDGVKSYLEENKETRKLLKDFIHF